MTVLLFWQILKREWPKNWESFIPDIIGASKTNESLCQNNMVILKLLSEEVFDFSCGQMTQTKAKHLKDTMCSQFSEVFQLCQFVLDNSQNAPLVGVTLETLLRFLNWIPLGYIFETKLIDTLIFKFLSVPMFRNLTLKCLTEIAAVTVPHYDEMFVTLFTQSMQQVSTFSHHRLFCCAHLFSGPKGKCSPSSSLPSHDKCHKTSRIFMTTEQTLVSARGFGVIF